MARMKKYQILTRNKGFKANLFHFSVSFKFFIQKKLVKKLELLYYLKRKLFTQSSIN